MTLTEVAALLNSAPKSWNTLTAQERIDVDACLAPKIAGFDGQQRPWFDNWWFVVTQANLDAMNAALPANVRVSPVSYLGTLYLKMDLATDCMGANDTYALARPVLRTLICTNVPNLPTLIPRPTVP